MNIKVGQLIKILQTLSPDDEVTVLCGNSEELNAEPLETIARSSDRPNCVVLKSGHTPTLSDEIIFMNIPQENENDFVYVYDKATYEGAVINASS